MFTRSTSIGLLALGSLAFASACGSSTTERIGSVPSGDDIEPSHALDGELLTASCEVESAPHRVAGARQGSTVAVVGGVALLADRDRKTLHAYDLDARRITSSTPLSGAPEQVLALGDGRVVVSIGDGAHIEVLAHRDGVLRSICARAVPAGAFGLAASVDETRVVVSSTSGAASVLDAADFSSKVTVALARSPRGVLVEGETVFVTHLSGARLSAFSLGSEQPVVAEISTSQRAVAPSGEPVDFALARGASQSYALVAVDLGAPSTASEGGRGPLRGAPIPSSRAASPAPQPSRSTLVLPMVSVDPGARDGQFQNYYGPPPIAGINKLTPTGVVVDPASRTSLSKKLAALDHAPLDQTCLLPRAAAALPGSSTVYVACLGSDEVLELEGARANPMSAVRRRVAVPGGPTGLAVSTERGELIVFSQFEASVTTIALDTFAETVVPLGLDAAVSPRFAVGRELFHRVGDARITKEGIACASCHPDALDDGVTWQTPEGPRQTILLAGKVRGSAPFGWTRGEDTLEEYIRGTCNRLGGSGLEADEIESIARFLETVPPPPANVVGSAAEAGRVVFEARGCSSCHAGGVGVDGRSHRFGNDHLAREYEPARDTPSLLRVSQSGPYFHDGRYPTLEAMLADPRSGMGETRDLSAAEQASLLAFLRSL